MEPHFMAIKETVVMDMDVVEKKKKKIIEVKGNIFIICTKKKNAPYH
jgi:hypothetical protein